MGFAAMGDRHRRRVRDDGRVVEVLVGDGAQAVELEGGRVVSVSPPVVRLRTGEVVSVSARLRAAPLIGGADVVVVRRGSFVLLLGEVVML